MADDVVLNEAATIERSLALVREVRDADDANLRDDPTSHDSILLNPQRACEASIDLAMHIVRKHRLGVPQGSREALEIFEQADVMLADPARSMRAMVGFRNVAVHSYAERDLAIVSGVIRDRLSDFADFSARVLREEP